MNTSHATDGRAANGTYADAPELRLFVFALFFIFGGITSLNDVIIPKLKGLFTSATARSCWSNRRSSPRISSSRCRRPRSCARSATCAPRRSDLLLMTAGCLLFVPASSSGMFGTFLAALFVLAAGITIVQVVANPLISLLGAPRDGAQPADFRAGIQFARHHHLSVCRLDPDPAARSPRSIPRQLAAAALAAFRAQETHVIVRTYLGLAAALVLVAAVVWLRRNRLQEVSGRGPFDPGPAVGSAAAARVSASGRCAYSSMSAPKWRSVR